MNCVSICEFYSGYVQWLVHVFFIDYVIRYRIISYWINMWLLIECLNMLHESALHSFLTSFKNCWTIILPETHNGSNWMSSLKLSFHVLNKLAYVQASELTADVYLWILYVKNTACCNDKLCMLTFFFWNKKSIF